MAFFKEIGKFFRNTGRVIRKVATPLGVAAGTLIGGPAGATIGGQIGGVIGGLGSSVPNISAPNVNIGYQPSIGTPGYTGLGQTYFRDGSVRGNGRALMDKSLNNEVFGSPTNSNNSNSNSSATPLLFGLGALLLLSD